MTVVLAIDPGSEQSAWVAWDGVNILAHDEVPNVDLVRRLAAPHQYICGHSVDELAVEMVSSSYGHVVGQEVFDTAYWVGRFVQAWSPRECKLVNRKTVVTALCGNPRAGDAGVRQAILDLFGGKAAGVGSKASPGPLHGLKADRWAAMALALCVSPRAGQGASL